MGSSTTISLAEAQATRLDLLAAAGDVAAAKLVTAYRLGPNKEGGIDEATFLKRAASFKSITRSDAGGALNRAVALHAPRGFSIPDHTYEKIFGEADRGHRVSLTEAAIRNGEINPEEVLRA